MHEPDSSDRLDLARAQVAVRVIELTEPLAAIVESSRAANLDDGIPISTG